MSRRLRPWLFLLLGFVAIFALSPFVDTMDNYDQQIVINIGIAMIMATSLNLINGFTGQFSLGHAGFMAVGAYTSSILTVVLLPGLIETLPEGLAGGAIFFAVLLSAGIMAGLTGLMVGVPSLRLKGDYLAIVTLGFGEMIRVIFNNITFATPTGDIGGPLGISGIPLLTTFLWVFGTVVVLVFIVQQLIGSTYGKGFLAVRDDEIAAESVGIDTTRYKVVAFVVGAFFAGIAGGLYAHYSALIRPEDFNFLRSVEIVVMVILGGMGSTWGVLLAAALLTYLPEWLRGQQIGPVNLTDFRMPLYALTLIILMLTRPQGLFGDFRLDHFIRRIRERRQSNRPRLEG